LVENCQNSSELSRLENKKYQSRVIEVKKKDNFLIMKDAKWKDHLLRSSLPLEHAVSEELARQKWMHWGQYAYRRNNETGVGVDFSVDVEATKEFPKDLSNLAYLQVLLECKYASPGVRWVFLPYPRTAQLFSGVVSVFEEVANKRVTNHEELESFEENLPYCIRGVALSESGCDESAINRGQHQLGYAMPRLAADAFTSQLASTNDEDIHITFACAIIVTTAPLFTLNEGVSVDQVLNATSLDSLANEQEALVLWDSRAPDRRSYTREIYQKNDPNIMCARVQKYASVFAPTKKLEHSPYASEISFAMHRAGDYVVVVNDKHLPSLLNRLYKATAKTAKSIVKIASVDLDPITGELRITGATPDRVRNTKRPAVT
jgi:hypothetical protein